MGIFIWGKAQVHMLVATYIPIPPQHLVPSRPAVQPRPRVVVIREEPLHGLVKRCGPYHGHEYPGVKLSKQSY